MLMISINEPFQTNFAVQTDDQIIANSLGMSYGQYATQGEISDGTVVIDVRNKRTSYCVTCFPSKPTSFCHLATNLWPLNVFHSRAINVWHMIPWPTRS